MFCLIVVISILSSCSAFEYLLALSTAIGVTANGTMEAARLQSAL